MPTKINLKGIITSDLRDADLTKLTIELRDQNLKIKGAIAFPPAFKIVSP